MSKVPEFMQVEKLKAVVLSLAEKSISGNPDFEDLIRSARLIWTELYGERYFGD